MKIGSVDWNDVIPVITVIIIIILISVGIIYTVIEENGKFECVDYMGNDIICYEIDVLTSGIWGKTEDDRWVQIASYKKLVKEDK